jgi:integrase
MPNQINRLQDRTLRAWMKAGKPIRGASDGSGLTFTLSASGTATWTFRYRLAGKQREMTLGRYPDITLQKARQLAAEKRAEVQRGIDVAAQKQQALAEHREAGTVNELAELWLDHAVRGKHKHPQATERVFRRDILPTLGKQRPRDVTRPQLARLLAKINASGRPTIANDVLRYLKSMFAYGDVLGMVESNPTEGLRINDAGGSERARSRYLTQAELRTLFEAIKAAGTAFGRDNELSVLLLLATGCRKMELLAATWNEFDLDGGLWRIPAARTKTGESRELPLPAQVVGWLEELKVRAAGNVHVFPARRASKRFAHVSPDTLWRALQALEHGLAPFSVHDLRRTSRSLMADLGVAADIAEKILGHKLPAIMAVYDRGDSTEQKLKALQKVAAKLVELQTGQRANNVVSLRAAG